MDARKEIELAIKRENPDWDGKKFDYGCAIYQNALECYEAIQPIIKKAGHSGFSYGLFVNVLTRLLDGKVLTPITEKDFEETFSKESGLADRIGEDGTITRQCVRYSSLFRDIHPDGTITYSDVNRIIGIDQYGCGFHSGHMERLCKEFIPEIKLPYMPTDRPIKIYEWQFCYEKGTGYFIQRGTYNACYIDRIVFPDGKVIQVNRLYLDDENTPITPTKEQYDELKAFIDKEVENFNKELWNDKHRSCN